MPQLAERSTEELRRELVEQRRAMVALTKELRRLQSERAAAPADRSERLLDDMDRVAARHRATATAIDDLSDALIRQDRVRAAKRTTRLRLFLRAH